MRFTAETRRVLEKQNFTPAYMNGGRMSRQKITGFTKKKTKITNSKKLLFMFSLQSPAYFSMVTTKLRLLLVN